MAPPPFETIVTNIRAIRNARGKTLEELAKLVGLPNRMSMNRIENCVGKKEAAGFEAFVLQNLLRFAEALDVATDELQFAGCVDDVLRCLEINGYLLHGTAPRLIDPNERGIWGFVVQRPETLFSEKIAVLYAPVIGRKQVRDRLGTLSSERLDGVLLVSQFKPDDGAEDEIRKQRGSLKIKIIQQGELERSLLSLLPLADRALRFANEGDRHRLIPPIQVHGEFGNWLGAQAFFSRWINEKPSHLYLNGLPGSGKTTWLHRLAAMLAAEHKRSPARSPCPVYIRLQPSWNLSDFRGEIVRRIWRDVSYSTYAAIEQALDQGRFALLLDGLDELVGPDPGRVVPVGWALDSLLELPSRIVLTARTHMLLSREHPGYLAGGFASHAQSRLPMCIAQLKSLNDNDVRDFIGTRCPGGGRALTKLIEKHNLADLAREPWFLDLLVEAQTDNIATDERLSRGLQSLLNQRYRTWVSEDARHFGMLPDEFWDQLGELASETRRQVKRRCDPTELSVSLAKRLWPDFASQSSWTLARAHRPSSRLLDFKPEGVCFVHVVMERFFFTDWVAKQMRAGQADTIAGVWLSWDDMQLLADAINEDAIVDNLERWAQDCRTEPRIRDMASYVLGFARRPSVLNVLRAVAQTADPSSPLVESAQFSCVLHGDTEILNRVATEAQVVEASRNRTRARWQLVALEQHRSKLAAPIEMRIKEILSRLSSDELGDEIAAILKNRDEKITTRARAAEALGHLKPAKAQKLLNGVLEEISALGPLERGIDHLRLAMASRAALEHFPPPRS